MRVISVLQYSQFEYRTFSEGQSVPPESTRSLSGNSSDLNFFSGLFLAGTLDYEPRSSKHTHSPGISRFLQVSLGVFNLLTKKRYKDVPAGSTSENEFTLKSLRSESGETHKRVTRE